MLMTALILISVTLILVLIGLGIRSNNRNKHIEELESRIEELERLQKATQDRLIVTEEEKQQLFGIVSHDLKGPFNRIFALIQLLQGTSGNFQSDQQEYLAKIHRVIADGLGMMRNLSDNQKLDGNKIDFTPETFNLSAALAVLTKNYKNLTEKKNIQLHADILPNVMVHADKYFVHRILDNLLSNALKFSNERSNINIRTQDDGSMIHIAVQDEGPGISEEDQMKLFRKFQTLTARPTGGETTTGLGLAVSKALADKMDAEISCMSKLEEGSLFTLTLRKVKTLGKLT